MKLGALASRRRALVVNSPARRQRSRQTSLHLVVRPIISFANRAKQSRIISGCSEGSAQLFNDNGV
jgi:hypothetical protein